MSIRNGLAPGEGLGVIVPTYNEDESIASLIGQIRRDLPSARIVVVDDSPGPETAQAVRGLADPGTELIKRETKGGRGSAVIAGLRHLLGSDCGRFLEMDADFSHPPQQISELVRLAEERNADLVIASRYLRDSQISNWPLSRRVFSRLSNFLARSLLAVPVRDYTNGFRCYSRRAAELIVSTCGQRGSGFIALSEILVSIYYRGMQVVETPTHFINRVRGQSSLNRREIANALQGLFKIYGLKRELSAQRAADARASL